MVVRAIEQEMKGRSASSLETASTIAAEEVNTPICAHYWIIEPAKGPVSLGVCQVCQEAREFDNFVDGWDSEVWLTNKRGVHHR